MAKRLAGKVAIVTGAGRGIGRTFFVEKGRVALYSEPVLEKQLVKPDGWTIDELFMFMPGTMTKDLVNPDPLQPK